MELQSLTLSLWLALWTCLLLFPIGILLARWLSFHNVKAKFLIMTLITLPLLLPPTVLGYYLLISFNQDAVLGGLYQALFGQSLLFSFQGLLLASIIFNLPFVFQPMFTAFSSIPVSLREAAWTCGLNSWQTFVQIELPLAWPGIVSALILTFAHTLGEFGVVLMVGGNIAGETRTVAIDIYDKVQLFDDRQAGVLSAMLLSISFTAIACIYLLNQRLLSNNDR